MTRRTLAAWLLLFPHPAAIAIAQPPPGLTIQLSDRALRQGELIVLTISAPAGVANVQVRIFERAIAAFQLDDDTWQALVGIDLQQRPGHYTATVEAASGGGVERARHDVSVVRRTFPVRTLRVAPDFVNPPPALLSRIEAEREFTRQVYAISTPDRLWSEPFVRPVPQPANSSFGTRSLFNGEERSAHAGTDFLSPAGTPIKAPNAGRIVAARDLFFTGNTVIIDHGLGVFSLLAHLSRLDVREGETVTPGQTVGLVGATGRVTGPHLHWAFSVSGARVDPLSLLQLLGPVSGSPR